MKTELLRILTEMAKKEKKINEFKRRIRVKGKIIKKGLTKNGNAKLIVYVKKDDDKYNFIVLKSHKDKFELAQKLDIENFVSAQGINKFRAVICTQLKQVKRIDESKQSKLENF